MQMENNRRKWYSSTIVLITVLIVGVFFVSFSLRLPNSGKSILFSYPRIQYRCSNNNYRPNNNSNSATATATADTVVLGSSRDELGVILEKAAAAAAGGSNKTVIITVVNKTYVEEDVNNKNNINMLDLFLESFWLGDGTRALIRRLLVVAVDQTSYERCLFRGLNCYLLLPQTTTAAVGVGVGGEGEVVYMSKDFINMMWSRTLFLLDVLHRGYNFIFTDADVMWLRNPFLRLKLSNLTYDIQFSTDHYNGNPSSNANPINTGFYFVRSNNKTISLFENWYAMKDNHNSTGLKEQDVLQNLIRGPREILSELNLVPTFLDTRYFSGFCADSKDVLNVVTVHANCCRYISAKLKDLTSVLNDWKSLKKSFQPKRTANSFRWSPHIACQNSWKS